MRCVVQVAALLLAAAALSAQVGVETTGAPFVKILAAGAALAFSIAGLLCFLGIRAGQLTLPGEPPSWWGRNANVEKLDEACAEYWVAGQLEDAIVSRL